MECKRSLAVNEAERRHIFWGLYLQGG